MHTSCREQANTAIKISCFDVLPQRIGQTLWRGLNSEKCALIRVLQIAEVDAAIAEFSELCPKVTPTWSPQDFYRFYYLDSKEVMILAHQSHHISNFWQKLVNVEVSVSRSLPHRQCRHLMTAPPGTTTNPEMKAKVFPFVGIH